MTSRDTRENFTHVSPPVHSPDLGGISLLSHAKKLEKDGKATGENKDVLPYPSWSRKIQRRRRPEISDVCVSCRLERALRNYDNERKQQLPSGLLRL